jgi:hypothetical protein
VHRLGRRRARSLDIAPPAGDTAMTSPIVAYRSAATIHLTDEIDRDTAAALLGPVTFMAVFVSLQDGPMSEPLPGL